MPARWIDLAVIILYLLGITWFGSRFRNSQKSLKDYFLGGRTAPWWAIGSFARLEAQIVSRLAGVLDGGFLIPLRHDRFYFDPDGAESTAFQVPTAGAFARLGILVSLN